MPKIGSDSALFGKLFFSQGVVVNRKPENIPIEPDLGNASAGMRE
jgi:hypothetical protein